MIELEIKETGKKFYLKNKWNEFNQIEFIAIARNLYDVFCNKCSVSDFQVRMFYFLSAFKFSNTDYTESQKEEIYSKIYQLSEMIDFAFIYEKDKVKFNFDIDKFYLEKVVVNGKQLTGLNLKTNENGIITTNMTAEEFVDAYNFYVLFENTKKYSNLFFLCSLFLRPTWNNQRSEYNTDTCIQNAWTFDQADKGIVFGCYVQFAGLMNILLKKTNYSILFNRESVGTEGKLSLGMSETIYSLSKTGYGPVKEIAKMNLFEYLDLLLKETIDSVKQIKELEKSISEISQITGLSVEQINKII